MSGGSARLDVELVRRGLARSRARAVDLLAGSRVWVDGQVVRKPSQVVSDAVVVTVTRDGAPEYVSRAAHKLVGALDDLEHLAPGGLSVDGLCCLDAGACTGGFTQVLLERGATHVLAVDVGHGQIAPEISGDPRVTVREGTNVRQLSRDVVPDPVDLVVADLSFISLTLVLAELLGVVKPQGSLVVMVKPQFEVGKERLGASGVVTSSDLREEAVVRVADAAESCGAHVRAVVPSKVPGPAGNREYFLWLARALPAFVRGHDGLATAVRAAVREGEPVLVGPACAGGAS